MSSVCKILSLDIIIGISTSTDFTLSSPSIVLSKIHKNFFFLKMILAGCVHVFVLRLRKISVVDTDTEFLFVFYLRFSAYFLYISYVISLFFHKMSLILLLSQSCLNWIFTHNSSKGSSSTSDFFSVFSFFCTR